MKKLTCILIFLSGYFNIYGQEILPGTRDPWLWPFSQNSIWNQPIGSEAIYVDANLKPANNVDFDIQHIMELSSEYPERQVLGTDVWGPGRCDGTNYLGFTLRVPDYWIVPDAISEDVTPNNNFAFRLPNSNTVFEGNQVSRCVAAGPVYLPGWMNSPSNRSYQSIIGNGLNGSGQGASGMSALGGTIRLGEFISDEPIRHAIKINPWAAKYCYYHDTLPGFKWPATSADSYASTVYLGNDPNIVMGSLLAIPPDVTSESIGIKTFAGEKLFFTMQNYGVYFTEDSYGDYWGLIVERGVDNELLNEFGFSVSSETFINDMNKLMTALSVVTNNSPNQIGGGGAPIQPLAPDFDVISHNIKDTICQGEFIVIGDSNFTQTGKYTVCFSNNFTCDSMVNLDLTVNPTHDSYITDTICKGESIQIGDSVFSEPGSHTISLKNQLGCDSTINLSLSVNSINTSLAIENSVLKSEQPNASYKWLDCNKNYKLIPNEKGQTFTATSSGSYAVEITLGNCIDTSQCHSIMISSILEYNDFGKALQIYPNPTEQSITIDLGSNYSDIYIKILSSQGLLVQNNYIGTTNKFKHDLPETKGIYIFQIDTKTGEKAKFSVVKY